MNDIPKPQNPSTKQPRRGKAVPPDSKAPTKLERMLALLTRPDGATLADLCAATGWQTHSVRGALAGTLKRKGLAITSSTIDGVRRYRAGADA